MRSLLPLLALLAITACSPCEPEGRPAAEGQPAANPVACPATAPAPDPLPGVRPEHRTAAYWIALAEERGDTDAPILSETEILEHDRRLSKAVDGWPLWHADLLSPIDPEELGNAVSGRLAPLSEALREGRYVDRQGAPAPARELRLFEVPRPLPHLRPEWRIALDFVPLRCAPRRDGFFTAPVDPDFDRNLCSTLRPQEPVQLLARWFDGLWLARTRYTLGWLDPGDGLSPPLDPELAERLVTAPRLLLSEGATLEAADGSASVTVPDFTLLSLSSTEGAPRVWIASAAGIHEALLPAGIEPGQPPLTRRRLLTTAFALLGTPYGWGGQGGGRDCSRFLMDLFASFGLLLPRNSGQQARAGTFSIDVDGVRDEDERLGILDDASGLGAILLQLPGHIMLYLGRDRSGTPMVLHAFAEYVEPCAGGAGETLRTVDRVSVSDLSLGRGSSRGSLLERITRVTVIGRDPR